MIGSNLFYICKQIKMYREFVPRYIFFALFSQIRAKKFIFGAIFVVVYVSHLMHSVGVMHIMSHSN